MELLAAFALTYWTALLLHEAAHALTAALCGMTVRRFVLWLDIGDLAIMSFRIGETEFTLGCLPLGGYTVIDGADRNGYRNETTTERSFTARPAWQQLLVVLAGAALNLATAAALTAASMPPRYTVIHLVIALMELRPTTGRDGAAAVTILSQTRDRKRLTRLWWIGWTILFTACTCPIIAWIWSAAL
jgi:membrane-associated protease RseP (regulator of RpoE activity)